MPLFDWIRCPSRPPPFMVDVDNVGEPRRIRLGTDATWGGWALGLLQDRELTIAMRHCGQIGPHL